MGLPFKLLPSCSLISTLLSCVLGQGLLSRALKHQQVPGHVGKADPSPIHLAEECMPEWLTKYGESITHTQWEAEIRANFGVRARDACKE
eukprot:4858936-Pyramimonas_sp.AAC.1